jgi:ankyrin repeat protein
MFKFLLNEINFNNTSIKLNIHKADCNGQNVLHHAVKLRQKDSILYLVNYDADYDILINKKDIKRNTQKDLDKTKSFENELYTIWDAAKDNNIEKMEILLNELEYYKVNDQTKFKGNTPLHLAVKNRAEKAILFLILNGANKNIKNKEGLNPIEYLNKEKNVDPAYVKTVEKIFDGKIKNYIELDSCNFEKLVKKEEDVKFSEKVDIVNGNIEKINFKKNKKNKKDNTIDKLSYGILTNFKLKEILSIINTNIKTKNIDANNLIKQYDKNSTGFIGNHEFNEFIKSLDIKELNDVDINFLKSFLEKDENNNIKYKNLIMIIKD